MSKKPSVAIIGAGLTGLSAGYFLQKEGVEAQIFEASGRMGGAITTQREGDYLFEQGPSTLLRGSPVLETLLRELDLAKDLTPPNPKAKKRFVVRGGKPVALPGGPLAFPFSPWLSWKGKLRLLTEPFRKRGAATKSETVANFAQRRLGREVLDYGVNPFVGGIYAGDPKKLAVALAFPTLVEAEEKGGSLFRGFLKLAKEKKKARGGAPRPPKGTVSFASGLEKLPQALAKALHRQPLLNSPLQKAEPTEDGHWRLTFAGGEQKVFEQILLTTWSDELAAALPAPPDRESWPHIDYAPVQVITLTYPREAVEHALDGFGVLVPEIENLPFLGVIFASSLFSERAPSGEVLLNLFVGGKRHPEKASFNEAQVRREILPAVAKLLSITEQPKFYAARHWPQAIPQYTLDHQSFLLARHGAEKNWPGFFLAGNMVDGISMPQCLESGHQAAQKIRSSLKTPTKS
ncbi:MAG: protoporphyrinogen oxidase [Opitutales bacterium]|nr:protoporphyrinogen oxidase [Opitutales bacterium]MCH8539613.1 protoporphyrinogen oxidase [Opitutales bacterium]